MSGRTVVLALVAVLLGAALVVSRYFPERLPWFAAPPRPTAAPAARELRLEPPVAERLARIDARLRLPPDRRALLAIGEIRRLAHGGANVEAEVAYVSGSWKVSYAGEPLGVLSAFPPFSALLALLDTQAEKEHARPGAVSLEPDVTIRRELQTLLNRFDDAAAFELLAAVDASWRDGKASVGDLLAANEALAQLCLILPHDFPAADRLAARALASLALARQHAPERALRAEIKLAYAMGYVEHAAALAERLPRDEPLGAFVRRDFGALERVAEWSDSGDVHFYYAARLVGARSDDEWIAWYRKLPPERASHAALVGTALEEPDSKLAEFVPELYATTLLNRFGVPVASALGQCDALRPRGRRRARGDWSVPSPTRRSTPTRFAPPVSPRCTGSSCSSPTRRRAPNPPWRAACRRRRVDLGAEPKLWLARRALDALPGEDPRRTDVADALAIGLDSRAERRFAAGDLAREVYLDPDLEEKLYAATLDLDRLERPLLAARLASFRRDWLALWSMAESDAFRARRADGGARRARATEAARVTAPAPRLRAPADREPRVRAAAPPVRALPREDAAQPQGGARRAAPDPGRARGTTTPASDSVAGIIARLYREDGDPRSAWALLEPRLAGMGVPYEAARAQVALGNLARAEEIARAAYAHYKHSLAPAAELAAVLWEAKRNAEAAEVIAKFPVRASDKDRCYHFCRAFVRTFRGKPPAEVEAAFHEMRRRAGRLRAAAGTIATFRDTAEPETALALGKLVDAPDAARDPHRVVQDAEADARRGRGDRVAGDGDLPRDLAARREDLLRPRRRRAPVEARRRPRAPGRLGDVALARRRVRARGAPELRAPSGARRLLRRAPDDRGRAARRGAGRPDRRPDAARGARTRARSQPRRLLPWARAPKAARPARGDAHVPARADARRGDSGARARATTR